MRIKWLKWLVRKIRDFFRWLLGKGGDVSPPSQVVNVQVIVDMTDVTIVWDLPTTRSDGTPFNPATDMDRVEILISGNGGADFTLLNSLVAADTQQVFIQDSAAGDWIVQHVIYDTFDQAGAIVDTAFTVLPAAPGTVQNVNVTIT